MIPIPPPPSGFSNRGSVTGESVTADDGTGPGDRHPAGADFIGFPDSGDSCDSYSLILGEKGNCAFSLSLVGPSAFPTDPPPFIDYKLRMRRDDWWTYYRPTVIRRAGGRCERCQQRTRRFEVHHLTYVRFGRELLIDLQALCEPCHKIADAERRRWTRHRYFFIGTAEDPAEVAWCEKVFGEDPSDWPADATKRYEAWERKQR